MEALGIVEFDEGLNAGRLDCSHLHLLFIWTLGLVDLLIHNHIHASVIWQRHPSESTSLCIDVCEEFRVLVPSHDCVVRDDHCAWSQVGLDELQGREGKWCPD